MQERLRQRPDLRACRAAAVAFRLTRRAWAECTIDSTRAVTCCSTACATSGSFLNVEEVFFLSLEVVGISVALRWPTRVE